jgi:hypothetical protein
LLSQQPVYSRPRTTTRKAREPAATTVEKIQKEPRESTVEEAKPVAGEGGEKVEEQAGGESRPEPGPASISSEEGGTTVQTESKEPSGEKDTGGVLAAPSASAATPPSTPPTYEPPTERKARPEYFEPF